MNKRLSLAARGAAVVGAVIGAEAAINALLLNRGPTPASELQGKQQTYDWRLGRIWYTSAGEGPPLLLVHGPGAGASSFEWRQNFSALAGQFEVFAIDLLGFGRSDHPALEHSGRFYVQLIDDFIQYVIKRPTNVVASSLSAGYAIRLAYTRPERIKSIIGVCPPELGRRETPPGARQLSGLLKLPVVGDSAYYALTSRGNIARTLRELLYYDPGAVTNSMIDEYYDSSHHPNDRLVIGALLEGSLDLDVSDEVRDIKQPLLLAWGAEALYSPPANARAYQEANGRCVIHLFQKARQFPQDEQADDFNRLVSSWLEPITSDQLLRVLA